MKTQILCGVSVSYKKKTHNHHKTKKSPSPACSHISGQQNCVWHLAFRVSFYHRRVKNAGSCSSTLKGRRQFALKTSDKKPLIPVQPTITVRHQPRKILRGGRGKNHSSLNLWLLCFCSYFFPLLQGHLGLFGFVILLSRQIKGPGDTQWHTRSDIEREMCKRELWEESVNLGDQLDNFIPIKKSSFHFISSYNILKQTFWRHWRNKGSP